MFDHLATERMRLWLSCNPQWSAAIVPHVPAGVAVVHVDTLSDLATRTDARRDDLVVLEIDEQNCHAATGWLVRLSAAGSDLRVIVVGKACHQGIFPLVEAGAAAAFADTLRIDRLLRLIRRHCSQLALPAADTVDESVVSTIVNAACNLEIAHQRPRPSIEGMSD